LKTNYVLIDYENVQPEIATALDKENFKVIVFVGANQAKVTFQVASALQQMGSRAEYIKIAHSGSNALDFHIAFYIGSISAKDPEAFFYIISKDTGFDPLIAHLRTKSIHAQRCKEVAEISVIKGPAAKLPDDKIALVLANLTHRGESKPRTVKTLTSTIRALFRKRLTDDEISEILAELQQRKTITVAGTRVTYTV
jgi:PIN domain